ncbi:MAG: pesticidal protein Cry7Aa [Candidatus Shapirobacteria bacterium]|nr:pesticidal protein Cry7Aa [Candidatus Shapirobacteria bacterium]
MIKMDKEIILESRKGYSFEEEGVFNPACIEKDGIVHMFYRAVGKENYSTVGYCQLKNNKVIYRSDKPIMVPEYNYEKQGIEDPRITYLDGKYYIFYTAFDGKNALVAYATSNDLKTFVKKGLITPQISYDEAEDIFRESGLIDRYTFFEKLFRLKKGDNIYLWEKDAMLFPKKIDGRYAIIHRILPGIQIFYFDDFDQLTQDYWRNYLKNLNGYIILDPKYDFENAYIGGGSVPIEVPEGWLMIYHSVEENIKEEKIYRAGVALLDKENPQKVIGRLPYPLFSPEKSWEKHGVVNNVVFPTATIIRGEMLDIYYGAADKKIAVKSVNIKDLIKRLKKDGKKHN